MTAETLRQLWTIVAELGAARTVSNLTDEALVSTVLGQINSRYCFTLEEQSAVKSYLSSHKPLIRDLLDEKATR
jgi:hypothetical protein